MVGTMHNDLRLQQECMDLIFLHGYTSEEVFNAKGIPASTVRTWKAHYLKFGRTPAVSRRERRRLGPRVNRRVFTPNMKAILHNIVESKPWLYLDEFQIELRNRTGYRVSISAIYKVLTREMNWSLQVAEVAARERNELERAEHQALLHEISTDPKQFVFIDETSKAKETSMRRRLWRPVNTNAPISRYFTDWVDRSYTMLGACDIEGFIPEACELVRRKRNTNDPDEEAGTIDANRFVEWVEFKLVPTLGSYALGEARSIVVMDNASIHNDPRVLELVLGAGAVLVYQSAYSPDLNPIEYCFHQYKSDLRRFRDEFANNHTAAHQHALASVSSSNMRAYYRRVGGIRNVPAVDVSATECGNADIVNIGLTLCLQQQTLILSAIL